jgi:uncharacterized protein (TIGR03086 family)
MIDKMFDLGPQTRIVARLAAGVREEQLADPTPCPGWAVRTLLGHLLGLATADANPDASLPDIGPGWREELPAVLDELAEVWRDPEAWTGATRAGGVTLPGAVAGAVAADELVIHGWDLARATGQEYEPDMTALLASYGFLTAAADDPSRGDGLFGPVVPVPADTPLLDRAIGLSGRDPAWKP